jgi:hypothetical protein
MNNNMKIILLVFMSSIVIDVVIRSFSEAKGNGAETNRPEPSLTDRLPDGYSVDEFTTHSNNGADYSVGGDVRREDL